MPAIEVISAYDKEPEAVAVYNANWHPVAVEADLSRWRSLDIPDCDGIIAGPPCQDASRASSNRKGFTSRGLNNLYVETAKIIAHKQPSWAIIENVQDMRRTPEFVQANEVLFNAGYWVTLHQMIHADFGGRTTRKRIFLIASRHGLPIPTPTHSKYEWLPHGEVLEPLFSDREPDGWGGWDLKKVRVHECLVPNATFNSQGWKHKSQRHWRYWNEPLFTVVASVNSIRKSRYNDEIYALNIHENTILQGFPSDYKNNYYRGAGNAVPPEWGRAWGKVIKAKFGKRQQVVSLFCGIGGFDFIQDV